MEGELMSELKELFKKREDTFKTQSEEIFASVPNVLDGCKKFVTARGGDGDLLEWDNISYLDEQNVVVLIGTISYNPGDTVELPNGRRVVVTENTAEYFKAMLRLGIPYDLAIEGSSEDIFNFLTETIEVEEISDEDPVPEEMYLDSGDYGFNLDELDEEQRKAMEMFLKTESMKENKN